MKMHLTLENCYKKSGDNPDRFVSCMQGSQKKISDVMESFQLKMLFLSRSAQNCIAQHNDVSKCTNDITSISQNMIQNLLKDIEKVWSSCHSYAHHYFYFISSPTFYFLLPSVVPLASSESATLLRLALLPPYSFSTFIHDFLPVCFQLLSLQAVKKFMFPLNRRNLSLY